MAAESFFRSAIGAVTTLAFLVKACSNKLPKFRKTSSQKHFVPPLPAPRTKNPSHSIPCARTRRAARLRARWCVSGALSGAQWARQYGASVKCAAAWCACVCGVHGGVGEALGAAFVCFCVSSRRVGAFSVSHRRSRQASATYGVLCCRLSSFVLPFALGTCCGMIRGAAVGL